MHGFVHQSGGTVTVASEIGSGTKITMYLPRARSEPAWVERQDRQLAGAAGGRILVVEDNPEVAEVTAALLEQLGYLTRVVGDAEAALQQLALGETFDLVFSDIVMAGPLDGTGLGRAIRERFPGLPVLLATGYAKAGDAAHGEFPTLRKPYQTAELDRAVGKLIAEAQRRMNETNLIQFRDPRKDRPRSDSP